MIFNCFHGKTCNGCEVTKCPHRKEKPVTNFERITESPDRLAEFIADAMFLYSTNRHIYTIEAVEMASKKEGINVVLDCNYRDVVEWLYKESES